MKKKNAPAGISRRQFLGGTLAAITAPTIIPGSALGLDGRPSPGNRITIGCIGMGGRGTGDMQGFLSFEQVQVVAVCDVRKPHVEKAKSIVNDRYGNKSCVACGDFREITSRPDIDAVLIGTPDHWHAIISVEAMRHGKDVFCEKPETLTVREGREMVNAAKLYGRVFSGGSQRVWGDYHWFHRMVRSGAIGEPREAWVNVGGPSIPSNLPGMPVPPDIDWDMWLGPAPMVPFNPALLNFRAWRDYSGGGMTDWGAHCFGGALFCLQLHETGPSEIIPPNGNDIPNLTFRFANGIQIYHNGGKGDSRLTFRGTDRTISQDDAKTMPAPNIYIPNYKGSGGLIGDFLHCVRTRELPFRNIEAAHRTVTVCHLGNIAYRLNRPLKWDPVKEEIIGDEEAGRMLSRPKRAPWHIV